MQLSNIIFLLTFIIAIFFFVKNLNKIISNIKLGKNVNRSDNRDIRLKNMFRVFGGSSVF